MLMVATTNDFVEFQYTELQFIYYWSLWSRCVFPIENLYDRLVLPPEGRGFPHKPGERLKHHQMTIFIMIMMWERYHWPKTDGRSKMRFNI